MLRSNVGQLQSLVVLSGAGLIHFCDNRFGTSGMLACQHAFGAIAPPGPTSPNQPRRKAPSRPLQAKRKDEPLGHLRRDNRADLAHSRFQRHDSQSQPMGLFLRGHAQLDFFGELQRGSRL